MTFDTQDTLRQTGYSEGDFIGNYSLGPHDRDSESTTSTIYGGSDAFTQWEVVWDQLSPNSQKAWFAQVRASPGTDETVDVRLQNLSDGETVVEEMGITTVRTVVLGPIEYTPTTTSALVTFRLEIKTDPGTNSSSIQYQNGHIGVIL